MRLNSVKFQVSGDSLQTTSYELRVTSYNKLRVSLSAFCFLLSTFCFLPSASAQRFIGGVAAGFNLTQVDGDNVFGYYKAGFNGGPYVKLMLDRKQRFSLTMELLYTQKGAFKKGTNNIGYFALGDTLLIDPNYPDYNKKYYYNLRTDYLEIPLLVHFEDPRSKVGIGIGLSWARLVYIKEYEWDLSIMKLDSGARRLNTTVNSGRYYKNDWGIIADVKIPIYKGLKFNFRFQYSLVPFGKVREFYISDKSTEPIERKPFHNTLTFRIIYSINEKYTENNNYDSEGNRIGPKWIRDTDAMRW
ncbi:MAG: PorT family protein [Lentimicrobiaceae bacterium]|nr:PorT family protein [Lentimicrobiaceae bacterium]